MEESTNVTTEWPRIDSLLVADWAESLNGKLYLMGGGFDTFFAPSFPFTPRFSVAGLLLVPWADTNRRFPIGATIETIDGEELGWKMQGELEAGRAPGSKIGDVMIAFAAPVQFEVEDPVELRLRLRFADDERSVALRVAPALFQMPQPPAE